MMYFSLLPRELYEVIQHYAYNDNLHRINEIYRLLSRSFNYYDDLTFEEAKKKLKQERTLKVLATPVISCKLKFNISCEVKNYTSSSIVLIGYGFIDCSIEINCEEIVTDNMLYQIISDKIFLSNLSLNSGPSCYLGVFRHISQINALLEPCKFQICVHIPKEYHKDKKLILFCSTECYQEKK
jgi:hypothetical protein